MKRMKRFRQLVRNFITCTHGSIFVEYLLLLTIVGIGVIAGLAVVRQALLNEMTDLAGAIEGIAP